MQFDEQNFENGSSSQQGNDISSISWEDLLDGNGQVDLDSLVKKSKGDEKENVDLNAATNNYVDSLVKNDKGQMQDNADEILQSGNSMAESMQNTESDDIFSIDTTGDTKNVGGKNNVEDLLNAITAEDDVLLTNNNTEPKVNTESFMNDEELLSLLDDNNQPKYDEPEIVEAPTPIPSVYEPKPTPVVKPKPRAAAYVADTIDDYNYEEYIPMPAKKKGAPVLVLVMVFAMLGAGAAFVAKNYFGYDFAQLSEILKFADMSQIKNMISNATTEMTDLTLSPDSNYAIEGNPNEAPEVGDIKQTTQPVAGKNVQPAPADKAALDKTAKEKAKPKTVISVQSAGRKNPFVPSALFNDTGYGRFTADLIAPPDLEDNEAAAEARKLFSIAVSGIMFDADKPSAILRYDNMDYFVQKGDKIDSYTVSQITKDYVAIKNGSNSYKAYVGEEFKIKDNPLPASQMIKLEGEHRRYVSPGEIQISTR